MTSHSKKQAFTSRQQRAFTEDQMPKTFVQKYVLFMRHTQPKPGVSLPVIGWVRAENKTQAKQQFASAREMDERYLFVQRWTDATIAEREQAEVLQEEWEAQQKEDQAFDADVVYLQKLVAELRVTEEAIARLEAKINGDVLDLDAQADQDIAEAFKREVLFPGYHPSDVVEPIDFMQRSRNMPMHTRDYYENDDQTKKGSGNESLKELYMRTVKRLREDGYLE
jgi:hypothetical protein